jgi:uncharacterized protein (TIGR04141 family)
LKLNIFKIDNEFVDDLVVELEENGYSAEADVENQGHSMTLYLKKKTSDGQGWIDYYKSILALEVYNQYSQNLGSESISGVYLVENDNYSYAVTHGQAHFIVRKYCDKDFGLNLAERIVDPSGLKMKHSQTFTSASKKDITSYTQKRKFAASMDYGEAFSYVKCKTIDREKWGETVDFGESARFTSGKDFLLTPQDVYELTDRVDSALSNESIISLPRYRKVSDKNLLEHLNSELDTHFLEFISGIDVEDYWLTGVSFNFSNDYKYSLKYRSKNLSEIMDNLEISTIKRMVEDNQEIIKGRHDLLKIVFYDEDENVVFSRYLKDLVQITIDYNGKYYVLIHNEWVEFSDSYVKFVENQVDQIPFEFKDSYGLSEDDLIAKLVNEEDYIQLHKKNIYVDRYCIEKADLMDSENVIMIKDQNSISDLVYLVKQATTSLRLSESGEIKDSVFKGHNVCLWMLVNRKSLSKLSDFKSFHLLDALNDFKKTVTGQNLAPLIWISLKGEDGRNNE